MDGGNDDAELFLGCVAEMAAVIEMREESQVPWNTVPVRPRRQRSPTNGVASPGMLSPAAKRACQVNPYQLLTPPAAESVEDLGESVQVLYPPRMTRQTVRLKAAADRLSAEMCAWDQVSEGLRRSPEGSVCEECVVVVEETDWPVDRGRRVRSPEGSANEGDSDVERNQVREAAARLRTARFMSELSDMPGRAIDGDTGVEANVSVTDEQAFSTAVSDPGRWRSRGSSSERSGSDGPGSASRSRRRRGRPRLPHARPVGAPQRFGCANIECGQVFVGKNAKKDLRYHFQVESEACRPREGQYNYYTSCGMWRCEKCDLWYESQGNHDCTKRGTVNMSNDYNRKDVRQKLQSNMRRGMRARRDKRAGPRRCPEAAGNDHFANVQVRLANAAEDLPNNWLGNIAARAEAEAEILGDLGARNVSEWECMNWLRELEWREVHGLVGFQTLRPSGKYSGPFHTAFRKCFAMLIKVHGSDVADAKLLSKKLLFLLVRLIYAPVDGATDINTVLLQRTNRFLKGEWDSLHEDCVEAANKRRGVTGQPTLRAQRERAIRLMEEGLVGQSVSLLGDSKICDVHKQGVMEQLKSQVVYSDESSSVARGPVVPDDLYSNPDFFCDTMEADIDEGQGRVEDNAAAAAGAKSDYVVLALRQMPKLGAQDWSGWRYDHIRALTKDQARWLVDIILNEEPEPEVLWLLTTAKVLPFEKEDGKARACIVGSMLRMFVARVVRLATRKDLQEEYESFNQFGLGTSSGIDTAYHSVVEHHRSEVQAYRSQVDQLAGEQPVLVKYDFKSAFPSIFRDVAFSFALRRFPKLCRYFAVLYGRAAQVTVTVGADEIESWQMTRGAMQGDPLGGDFFVCAKAEFAKDLNEAFPDVWFSWIIDDLTCSMRLDQVGRVDEFIKEQGAKCGLTVNEGKRGITSLLPEFSVTNELVESGIPYVLQESRLEGLAIGTASLGGWNKLLGCPVGTEAFCRQRAVEIVGKKLARLKDIRKFHQTQYEYVALSLCGGVADYLVRMLGPDVTTDALEVLDKCKREVFSGTIQGDIDDLTWQVAKAPSDGIGLDIKDPAVVAIPQYLGALGSTAKTLHRLEEAHRAANRLAKAERFEAVRKALGAKPEIGGLVTVLHSVVKEENIPNKILHIPSLDAMQDMPSSAAMSEYFHNRIARRILRNPSWTKAQVARLQSGGQPGAGLWATAIPAIPCNRTYPELFGAMLRSRLQMCWSSAECVRECRATLSGPNGGMCGLRADAEHAIDPHHYMFTCPGRNRHVGHDVLTKHVQAMYRQLGVQTKKEPTGLVDGNNRPADVLILPMEVCHDATLPVALDVGVTDAGCNAAIVHGSSKVPDGALKAAKDYTQVKLSRFEKLRESNPVVGFDYRPIVFEATSARGPEAQKWWNEITGLAKDKESGWALGYGALMEYNGLAHAWSGQSFARHWGVRLSLALMQATHRYGLGKVSEYTLVGGRRRRTRGNGDDR